tara:strand:+ start:812 stop:1234 length:423 start_codon:yes stop_codon:yes gene_type:complete
MDIEKKLNLLYKKLKTHSWIELKELCILFYINKKEIASLEEITEKFFYHKNFNRPLYSSAIRSMQKMGMGTKYKTSSSYTIDNKTYNGKEMTMKGAELINEKKYPDNVIKINDSDWINKKYFITKKGKKLINEIKEIWEI